MLKDIPKLADRLHPTLKQRGEDYFNEQYKKYAKINGIFIDSEDKDKIKKVPIKDKINWIFDDEQSTNAPTGTESDLSPIKHDDYELDKIDESPTKNMM